MKCPHLTSQNLVFNLQNKVHRHKKFFFWASAATLIEKEKREGGENGHRGGDGKKRGPVYCHICKYLYPSQFLTIVSYVEQ